MGVLDDYKYSTGNTGGDGAATPMVKLGSAVSGAVSSIGKTFGNIYDAASARLSSAGLLNGAMGSIKNANPKIAYMGVGSSEGSGQSSNGVMDDDWRIRLSVAGGSRLLYNLPDNEFLKPLFTTSGVIFPVTPNLQVTHTAKYSPTSLTHSNYGMHFYEGSEIASIMISGEFPIQNIEEGQYLLAAIYFFRASTKMYWGNAAGELAGSPPPMLFLNGYGAGYFPNVSCVVTSFQHSLPDNVDYMDVPHPGNPGQSTRLPTNSTLQITVQPIISRTKAHGFDLDQFAKGDLIKGGYF